MGMQFNPTANSFIDFVDNQKLYKDATVSKGEMRTVELTVNPGKIKRYTKFANQVALEIESEKIPAEQIKVLNEKHEQYSKKFNEILRPAKDTTTNIAPKPKNGFEASPFHFIALLILGLFTALIGIYVHSGYVAYKEATDPGTLNSSKKVSTFTYETTDPAEQANQRLTTALLKAQETIKAQKSA